MPPLPVDAIYGTGSACMPTNGTCCFATGQVQGSHDGAQSSGGSSGRRHGETAGPDLDGRTDGFMAVNESAGREAEDRLPATMEASSQAWVAQYPDAVAKRWDGGTFALGCLSERRKRASRSLKRPASRSFASPPTALLAWRDAASLQAWWRAAEAACWLAKEAGGNRTGLPAKDTMALKSAYGPSSSMGRLRSLCERPGPQGRRSVAKPWGDCWGNTLPCRGTGSGKSAFSAGAPEFGSPA